VYVETLDRSFESVCELDLIFNSPKARATAAHGAWRRRLTDTRRWQAYAILDEIVMGGAVFETSSLEALRAFNETQRRALLRRRAASSMLTRSAARRLEKATDTLSMGVSNQAKFRR
jgi:hypothetical protein